MRGFWMSTAAAVLVCVLIPVQSMAMGGTELGLCPVTIAGSDLLFLAAGGSGSERQPAGDRCSCNASAQCWNGSTLFCSDTTSPCSCTSQDQNCVSGTPGFVRCNGVTTNCAACLAPDCPNQDCPGGPCSSHADCCGLSGNGFCQFGMCQCP